MQVAEVLAEQALVRVDPEQDLQGVQGLGAELAVELRHHGQRGVSRHQPRQQEVEGKRRPQREDEETKAAQRVPQALLTWRASGAAAPARCPGRRTRTAGRTGRWTWAS